MLTISYNISSTLKDRLAKVEDLRNQILIAPISPQAEIALRWQANLAHLEGWALLSNQPLSKAHILDIVDHLHTKPTSPLVSKVLNYKAALDHVRQHWPANPGPVTFKHIEELADLLAVNSGSKPEIDSLLSYLQTGKVHPLIQSATAQLYFYPSRLSYLASMLFLAKYGYDLRGLISLEDYWSQDKDRFLHSIQQATKSANITLWLEYFCEGVLHQMEKIYSALTHPSPPAHPHSSTFWQISRRQRQILDQLNKPGQSIANKDVQILYKIHQVTASRNLAKLVSLGLLIPHGGGRSTKYTKA